MTATYDIKVHHDGSIGGDNLDFLTTEELTAFTQPDAESREAYLNSLGKGEFHVRQSLRSEMEGSGEFFVMRHVKVQLTAEEEDLVQEWCDLKSSMLTSDFQGDTKAVTARIAELQPLADKFFGVPKLLAVDKKPKMSQEAVNAARAILAENNLSWL